MIKISDEVMEYKVRFCSNDTAVGECVECYTGLYKDISRNELNSTCPIIEKVIIVKDRLSWFNAEIRNAREIK